MGLVETQLASLIKNHRSRAIPKARLKTHFHSWNLWQTQIPVIRALGWVNTRGARQKNNFDPFSTNFRCPKKPLVYVHTNMNRILLLKRWRPRIRLPRCKRRKRVQQLELNLWPKRR